MNVIKQSDEVKNDVNCQSSSIVDVDQHESIEIKLKPAVTNDNDLSAISTLLDSANFENPFDFDGFSDNDWNDGDDIFIPEIDKSENDDNKPNKKLSKKPPKIPNEKKEIEKTKNYSQIICDLCLITCKTIEDKLKHLKLFHNITKLLYSCDFCGKMLKTKVGLFEHIGMFHLKDLAEVICDQCGEKFVNSLRLRLHKQQYHERNDDYICDLCGKVFRSYYSIFNHMHGMHKKNRECTICKIRMTRRDYALHMKRGIHNFKFRCTYSDCTKGFNDQSQLGKN